MPLAVAALVSSTDSDAASDGTAFAIGDGLALTARHLVEDDDQVLLRFASDDDGGDEETAIVGAEVSNRDPRFDAAVLRLLGPLPPGYEPIPMGRADRALDQGPCAVHGYPHERPAVDDPFVVGGKVRDANGRFEGLPAVQLYLEEVAAGVEPGGFSGAPVLVQAPGWRERRAIGVVHYGQPRPEGGDGHGGVVFAAPITQLAGEWVGRLLAAEATALPATDAIRAFERQYGGPFAGRDSELARLDAWLSGDSEPCLLVSGPPGRGKSALLVAWNERLARRQDVDAIFVPITVRFGVNTQETALRALVARLAEARGETMPAASGPEEWRQAVAERLSRPLPRDRRLVVIVDGLDEAAERLARPGLFPVDPAPGVRILASARLTANQPTAADWLAELGWEDGAQALELDALDLAGVSAVLEAWGEELATIAADPAGPRTLHALTEGDPLVLSLTLDDAARRVRAGRPVTVDDLASQPQGRTARLKRWWDDQEELWGLPFSGQGADVRMVLNLLAVAQGPLERRYLRQLAGAPERWEGDRLNLALNPLERLVAHDPVADTYAMAHPLLGEDRVNQLERDDDLDLLDDRFIEQGLAALRSAQLSGGYGDISDYTLHHLGDHFVRRDVALEAWMELVGPAWRTAWEARTAEFEGHLRDVRHAERIALSDAEAALAAGRPAEHLADALACTLERASAAELRERVPPELAAELVRYGLWSGPRALGLAARLPRADDRVAALGAMAPHLDLADALAAAELLEMQGDAWELPYAAAVRALSVRLLALGEPDRAYELADRAPRLARGLSLAGLAPYLEERGDVAIQAAYDQLRALEPTNLERDDLVAAIVEIPVERVAATLGISAELAAADIATEASAQFDSLTGIAPVFKQIASWLPPAEAREIAKVVGDPLLERARSDNEVEVGVTSRALAELAPFTDPDLLLEVAGRVEDARHRALLILAVSENLPLDQRSQLLDRVCADLPTLLGVPNVNDRIEVAERLAGLGRGSEVLAAIRGLSGEDWSADRIVAGVAPHLDLAQVREGMLVVDGLRREIRDDAVGPLLARLASFGAVEAVEAFERSALPTDADMQLALVAVIESARAGSVAIEPLLTILDPELRAVALRSATGLVPATSKVAAAVLDSLGPQPRASQAFSDIYESASCVADLVPHAQWVMTEVIDGFKGPPVVGFLQRLAEEEGAEAAMDCVRGTGSKSGTLRMWAVAGCAQAAADVDVEWLQREAEGISDGEECAGALAALAKRVPALRAELTERVVELIDGAEIAHAGLVAFALERLDESARQTVLGDSLEAGFRNAGPSSVFRALILRDLAPVFGRDTILRLQDDLRDLGSGDRGQVLTAFGLRLAALGDNEGALALIAGIAATEHAGRLAAGLAAALPLELLGACLQAAADRLDPVTFAPGRGSVFATAGRRASEMGDGQAWDLLSRWLVREPPSGVFLDLHCYLPLMLHIGGSETLEQVAGLSGLARP